MTDAPSKTPRLDLYQRVTDEIVRAIEEGAGKFIMPWHGTLRGRPRNAFTGDAYRDQHTRVMGGGSQQEIRLAELGDVSPMAES
jgi:antirestriction protein ArdC